MGREILFIEIACDQERHNGPGDARDREARDSLVSEIEALVASTPEYERIVHWVRGGDQW